MNYQPAYELFIALAALAAITAGYAHVAQAGVPQASSALGWTLGIAGFTLMLATEFAYSYRKHVRGVHLGRMSLWLQIHIVTGLVGPYLVLLHSGWKFRGLAGVLTLIVGVVVVSGIIGRFIYTAVPRNLDGAETGLAQLEDELAQMDRQLDEAGMDRKLVAAVLDEPEPTRWQLVFGRSRLRRQHQRRLRAAIDRLPVETRKQVRPLEKLLTNRQRLLDEIRSLSATRRLLAWWRLFHIPTSAVLFVLAFTHVGAVLYYIAFTK